MIVSDSDIARQCIGLERRQVDSLKLRPLTRSDFSALHAILSARSDMTWEGTGATPEYTHHLLGFRLKHYETYGFGIMAVEDDNQTLIGQAGLQVLTDIDRNTVELVVFLAVTHLACGHGTVLSTHYISLARACGMQTLYATVRPGNKPADRLVQRLGFQPTGTATHFGMPSTMWRLSLQTPHSPDSVA
jgi:RimJ/RimL family protein N-acetyltransferase